MWFDWMPRTCSPTIVPASSGSSPPYSKLRPLRGSRARLTPPASMTLKPSARASLPIMRPPSNAIFGSHDAAIARLLGSEVAGVGVPFGWLATPMPESASNCGGMPRRGMPGT